MATIQAALALVMDDVQAVSKDGRNQQQNFNFRGIDAVVNAVGPALRRHGVLVLPSVKSFSAQEYATKNGTVMRMSTVEVEFTFVGPDGSTLTCRTIGEASDAGDKGTSKAHSVAFRTALLQSLCIPTDEPDPDESSHDRAPAVVYVSDDDARRMADLLNNADDATTARKAFVEKFGCRPAALPVDRLDEADDWLSDLAAVKENS